MLCAFVRFRLSIEYPYYLVQIYYLMFVHDASELIFRLMIINQSGLDFIPVIPVGIPGVTLNSVNVLSLTRNACSNRICCYRVFICVFLVSGS